MGLKKTAAEKAAAAAQRKKNRQAVASGAKKTWNYLFNKKEAQERRLVESKKWEEKAKSLKEKTLTITSWLKDTSTDNKEEPAHQFEKSCGCETCFQKLTDYRGTFQKTVEDNPFAIATEQAKEKGHEDFSEGSKGDKLKDKIAEALKRLGG